jgi:hypothetical protein
MNFDENKCLSLIDKSYQLKNYNPIFYKNCSLDLFNYYKKFISKLLNIDHIYKYDICQFDNFITNIENKWNSIVDNNKNLNKYIKYYKIMKYSNVKKYYS